MLPALIFYSNIVASHYVHRQTNGDLLLWRVDCGEWIVESSERQRAELGEVTQRLGFSEGEES